jgi:hypothetical protein
MRKWSSLILVYVSAFQAAPSLAPASERPRTVSVPYKSHKISQFKFAILDKSYT